MGGLACVAKKKMCDPPAIAAMHIPEEIIRDYQIGSVQDKYISELAGFAQYMYRAAWIDEDALAKYNQLNEWYYYNVVTMQKAVEARSWLTNRFYRMFPGRDPLRVTRKPVPWNPHEMEGYVGNENERGKMDLST